MAQGVASRIPINDPERELQAGESRAVNPEWNEAAEQIGGALGRAVNTALQMPHRASEIGSEVRERLEVIRARSRQQGASIVTRLREAAGRQSAELKGRAWENLQITRNRANRIVRERPLEIIVAAFAAAFLVGAGLRLWRSSRD